MVDEDLQRSLLRNSGKFFRRKRKHRGADWAQGDPPTLQEVHRGVWCPRCRRRHPYNSAGKDRLVSQYWKNSTGRWIILWLCPVSGDVIGDSSTYTIRKEAPPE